MEELLEPGFDSLTYTGLTGDSYCTRSIQAPSQKTAGWQDTGAQAVRRPHRVYTSYTPCRTFPTQGFLVLMACFTEQSLGNKLNLSRRGRPTH